MADIRAVLDEWFRERQRLQREVHDEERRRKETPNFFSTSPLIAAMDDSLVVMPKAVNALTLLLDGHVPFEYSGGGPEASDGVACELCEDDWPCYPIRITARELGLSADDL